MVADTEVPCILLPAWGDPWAMGERLAVRRGCQLSPWELLPLSALGTQPALGWCFLGRAAPKPRAGGTPTLCE